MMTYGLGADQLNANATLPPSLFELLPRKGRELSSKTNDEFIASLFGRKQTRQDLFAPFCRIYFSRVCIVSKGGCIRMYLVKK